MKMELTTILDSLGCQTPTEVSDRFLDDADFYVDITTKMLRDPGFEALGKQLEAEDPQTAFNTAHMLKGIIGNCGISALYDLILPIVEELRGGNTNYQDLRQLYTRLMRIRAEKIEKLMSVTQ